MRNEVFHDLDKIPFADRESFSNGIILLSMVRSSSYYMVGFSRPDSFIDVAFDFSGEFHRQITETMRLDFSGGGFLLIRSRLRNITPDCFSRKAADIMVHRGSIVPSEGGIVYELKIPKDKVIPLSVMKLNSAILLAREEICDFMEKCFDMHLWGQETP